MEDKTIFETIVYPAAKEAGVLGAIRDIRKNNPQLRSSILNYIKWIGPLAKKRNGAPLLPTVFGEAVRAYRKKLPDHGEANFAFRQALAGHALDCSYNHYVGETPDGTTYEWDIGFGDVLAFIEAHPDVTAWRVELRPFRNNQNLSDDFLRAFVIAKSAPASLWADHDAASGDDGNP